MAFPLLALPVAVGAGLLIYKGLRPAGFDGFLSAVKSNKGTGTPTNPRRTEVRDLQVNPIVEAVTRLGNVVGKPTAPGLNIVGSGYTVQPFKRESDGEEQVIVHKDGAKKAFLVRGGFFKLYAGHEKAYGLPTSDEFDELVSLMPGTPALRVRKQTFEKGHMMWLPASNRLVGFGMTRMGPGRLYDSKPPKRKKAWYEKAWDGITEEVSIGDIVFVGTAIAMGAGTVIACVGTLGFGCVPAAGACFSVIIPASCGAAAAADGASKTIGIEEKGKSGLTGGVCSVM